MPPAADLLSTPGAALASSPILCSLWKCCAAVRAGNQESWISGLGSSCANAPRDCLPLSWTTAPLLPASNLDRQEQLGHPSLSILVWMGLPLGSSVTCAAGNLSFVPQTSCLQSAAGCSWGSDVCPGFDCLLPCLCSPSQNIS